MYATAISPSIPYLVCSGGGDDQAYLWRADTGDTVTTLLAHKDSITDVRFSTDGTLIATGGMDGCVHVHAISPSTTAAGGVAVSYHASLSTDEDSEITVTIFVF